jgi:hypothetical protein
LIEVIYSLNSVKKTLTRAHFRYAGESSTLFRAHVMACVRELERLCYVWIKRYLWVWDKTLPQPPLNQEFERRPDLGFMVARERFELSAFQKCVIW